MKRISILAVGLSLVLLGGTAASAQVQIKNKNEPAFERLNKLNKFNKNEVKPKRKIVRKRVSNYSGKWKGTLYQPNGTLREKFNFTMRLYQKGKNVTGFSRITIIDSPQYYGVMRLEGTIKGNRLSFTETRVTKQNVAPDSGWCIKSGELKLAFIKGKLTLRGSWQGESCPAGTIALRKVSRK